MLKFLMLLLPLLAWSQEKRIIGLDQRVQVKDLNDPFHRTVGLLVRNGRPFCTATLIDPRHILTNAHCIVSRSGNGVEDPRKFTFIPGMLGKDDRPYGVFTIRRIDTFRQYIETRTTTHDIAVLELTKSLALPTIRRARIDTNVDIEKKVVAITGYSSQKPFGTMWEGRGITLDASPDFNLLSHDVDTLPGTSGAIMRVSTGRGWVAVGIHRGPVVLINNGVYFTPEVFDAINRWIKK